MLSPPCALDALLPPYQDLAAYRKFRDKEVASAARALVGLFRDINPGEDCLQQVCKASCLQCPVADREGPFWV